MSLHLSKFQSVGNTCRGSISIEVYNFLLLSTLLNISMQSYWNCWSISDIHIWHGPSNTWLCPSMWKCWEPGLTNSHSRLNDTVLEDPLVIQILIEYSVSKQQRHWSDSAYCGIRSESALLVTVCNCLIKHVKRTLPCNYLLSSKPFSPRTLILWNCPLLICIFNELRFNVLYKAV